jgi:hypothetical protein
MARTVENRRHDAVRDGRCTFSLLHKAGQPAAPLTVDFFLGEAWMESHVGQQVERASASPGLKMVGVNQATYTRGSSM